MVLVSVMKSDIVRKAVEPQMIVFVEKLVLTANVELNVPYNHHVQKDKFALGELVFLGVEITMIVLTMKFVETKNVKMFAKTHTAVERKLFVKRLIAEKYVYVLMATKEILK